MRKTARDKEPDPEVRSSLLGLPPKDKKKLSVKFSSASGGSGAGRDVKMDVLGSGGKSNVFAFDDGSAVEETEDEILDVSDRSVRSLVQLLILSRVQDMASSVSRLTLVASSIGEELDVQTMCVRAGEAAVVLADLTACPPERCQASMTK
jgi:hypothetical protein